MLIVRGRRSLVRLRHLQTTLISSATPMGGKIAIRPEIRRKKRIVPREGEIKDDKKHIRAVLPEQTAL